MSSEFQNNDPDHNKGRHSCESRNPERHWIPGQAQNDKPLKTYIVMYRFGSNPMRYAPCALRVVI